ncbi:MarR family winged helix-turn-helix transcriptional regulator [Streptomyces antimycoticus]|uniref:MarR family transcriptional regulator n=3 Tax=Streptomyces TaxID=1883 RepID=A0ABD5JH96_9ACTN|nr:MULTISPECIES: MarR family transcriptional regulator [Streptomyces]KUL65785.1 MarR family transcriptional regulator [Streptomyces violaceusniger]MEE4587455.1 MarR family transcriptional regulator [Streptomyces sp. DSM 41602]WTA79392.1 MarR family transcriptional regulator [Streptomyces antimycoticus]WTB10425.1 MarR family transcriptional regulator [Streptomyces antimycoticus]
MSAEESEAGQGGDGEHDLLAMLPRLTQLSGAVNRGRLTERAMEAAGVSVDRPAMSVLFTLRVAGGPLRVGEIASRMQVVGPHVTRQVNELARRGLVHRVTDPDDQRARLIEPTAEGAAATDRYMRTVLGWFGDALAGWSPHDREVFGRLLARFVDDLTAHLGSFDDDGPA